MTILLAALHFQSQLYWSHCDQALEATNIRENIIRAEDSVGHHRTIVVGDLNMNPFDPGIVGAHALNAVMTTALARRPHRTVAGSAYRFFYNPMWGHFGDRTPGPPGTYFYQSSNPVCIGWNMFDQVLVRPDVMDFLNDLEIVTQYDRRTLADEDGCPNALHLSDHFPIRFTINL